MTISFTRDSGNFQGLRDRNIPMAYVDFDNEFNKLSNYININLKPYVEILENKQFLGEIGKVNYFLQNISDGTTVFKAFNSNYLSKNSLDFNIFSILKFNSLISMSDKYFIDNVPPINNVIAIANNIIEWNKITDKNIELNSIIGDKVSLSTLTVNHIAPNVLIYGLQNDSIKTEHIIDKEITNNKIANNAITIDRLTPELIALRSGTPKVLENTISSRNIKNNSFDIGKWLSTHSIDTGNEAYHVSVFSNKNISKNSITLVPDGTLDTNLLSQYKISRYSTSQPQATYMNFTPLKKQTCIRSVHLKDKTFTFPVVDNNIYSKPIIKSKLSPELYAILKKGGLT